MNIGNNKSKRFPLVALFSNQIAFDNPVTAYPQKTISGPVTFTPLVTGATAGYGAILRVVADGTNVPDLTAFKKTGAGSYDNTNGKVNQLVFYFDGVDYCYCVNVLGAAQAQTTPSINGMTLDGSGIAVTFDRSVTGSTSGWIFKKNGVAMTITGVTQPTSSVLAFTYSGTVASSDTITASYDSTTGNTIDGSSNELVSFTNQAVTNNVNSNTTPAAPTQGTVNDTLDTFDFTYTPGYTTVSEYEYTLDGGTTTAALTAKPLVVGNVARSAGQVGVRVKAATGRNASAWLFSAQPFTVAADPTEAIIWGQLQNATDAGSGRLNFSGTTPTGGTATKKLAKADGNYIEYTIPATPANTDYSVFGLSSVNNAAYGWEPTGLIAATYYNSGGNPAGQFAYASGGTNVKYAAPAAGDVYRLEIANTNDVILKKNGATVHTFTGVLSGVTDIYIKGLNAAGGAYHILNAKGLGLI